MQTEIIQGHGQFAVLQMMMNVLLVYAAQTSSVQNEFEWYFESFKILVN